MILSTPRPSLDRRQQTKERQLPTVRRNRKGTRQFLDYNADHFPSCRRAKVTNGLQVCKSWNCSRCCLRKGRLEAEFVYSHLRRAAHAGVPVLHVVLTDKTDVGVVGQPMTKATFRRATDRWKALLKNSFDDVLGYYSALDVNPDTGRLHLHLLLFGIDSIPKVALAEADRRAKLGRTFVYEDRRHADHVGDPVGTTVTDSRNLANYMADNAVRYAESRRDLEDRIQPTSLHTSAPKDYPRRAPRAVNSVPNFPSTIKAALAAAKDIQMSKKAPSVVVTNKAASTLRTTTPSTFAATPEAPGPIRPKATPRSRAITPGPRVEVTAPAAGDRRA